MEQDDQAIWYFLRLAAARAGHWEEVRQIEGAALLAGVDLPPLDPSLRPPSESADSAPAPSPSETS